MSCSKSACWGPKAPLNWLTYCKHEVDQNRVVIKFEFADKHGVVLEIIDGQ